MKTQKKILALSLISVGMISLTSCSSFFSRNMPTGSVSMTQAYDEALYGGSGDNKNGLEQVRHKLRSLPKDIPDDRNYARNQENDLNPEFSRLPNPTIVMYVYPHRVGTGEDLVPVPGYSTVFSLYAHVYYNS